MVQRAGKEAIAQRAISILINDSLPIVSLARRCDRSTVMVIHVKDIVRACRNCNALLLVKQRMYVMILSHDPSGLRDVAVGLDVSGEQGPCIDLPLVLASCSYYDLARLQATKKYAPTAYEDSLVLDTPADAAARFDKDSDFSYTCSLTLQPEVKWKGDYKKLKASFTQLRS